MATLEYQDFIVDLQTLGGNNVRVTVVTSPVGSVSITSTHSLTADETSRVIMAIEGSLVLSRGERNQTIRAYGEKLFNTIFTGPIYATYLASLERVGQAGLRIRLSLDEAGPLADMPWELLRDPRGDYLVLSRQTPMVRYPRVITTRPLVPVKLPLRVLVMISSPSDQAQLDVEDEWRALQDSTASLRQRGLLQLDRVDNAQLITLQRKLRGGTDYQVFHYIGHAAFDDRSQTGMLAFEDPTNNTTVSVSGEQLARELSEENSIRLVVLNACQGARQNLSDPYAGIASSIVARGLPAVVAMQFAVSDGASRAFSQEFYRALSEGFPIESAVSEGRRSISSTLSNFEWATPVLYLRAPNGVLFPKPGSKATSEIRATGTQQMPAVKAKAGGGAFLRSRAGMGVIAGVVALVVLLGGGFVISRFLNAISTGVPSQTPSAPEVHDIDLVVAGIKFSPPNPTPGQHVTVAMIIKNNGTVDSGTFNWGWFASNPQENPTPSIKGSISNLKPGGSVNVKGDFYFGWWGTFITTAWVNFDNQVQETNFINNVLVRPAITSNDPLLVDFTRLPSGDSILEATTLRGDEFKPFGFLMNPETDRDQKCGSAQLQVQIQENFNRLRPALPNKQDACANLPVVFTFEQSIGGAAVQFFAATPGRYTLELFDEENKRVLSVPIAVTTANQLVTVRAPDAPPGLSNTRKVIFSGPEASAVEVRTIIFTLPGQVVPKPSQ